MPTARKAYDGRYRENNRERISKQNKEYRARHHERVRENEKRYQDANKDKAAARHQARMDNDADYNRRVRCRSRYGITLEEYEELLAKPCAICGEEARHLDHCHESGRIRAALCRNCNIMLGHAKDSPSVLRAAADYLDAHDTLDTTKPQQTKGG